MGLLFDHLGVLEPVNQLKFLLLHSLNFLFVELLLRRLPKQSFLHLSACVVLSFLEIHLALGYCLLLLHFDHHFVIVGLGLLLKAEDCVLGTVIRRKGVKLKDVVISVS